MRCSRRSANVGPSFSLGTRTSHRIRMPVLTLGPAESRCQSARSLVDPLSKSSAQDWRARALRRRGRAAATPTADLMRVFYFHLQRGAPRDEALRRAKRRFIRSGTTLVDPHYRAAFVMSGDALRPLPRAVTWQTVIVSAAGAALLFGIAAAFMRSVARRLSPARSALR
jgi:CHAT domain-containing protein